jgi:hypothetical protein
MNREAVSVPHYRETPHGFEYGAAKVTRCCSDKKRGWVVIMIETPTQQLEVYVTKTGKVRCHVHKPEVRELV